MIGYILLVLGGYLVIDDLIQAKRAKNENVFKDGNVRGGSNRDRKSRSSSKKSNRDGGITPIGVPTEKGVENGIPKKPDKQIGPYKTGDSAGDDSGSQSDTTTGSRKNKSLKGGENEEHTQNGAGNDGDHVDAELSGVDEPDSPEID